MDDPLDMTGGWFGRYAYDAPAGAEPVAFWLALAEDGGTFGGSSTEAADGEPRSARIAGMRTGAAFDFGKRYDDPALSGPILYEGRLAPGGEEAVGRWSLGALAGGFEMSRRHADDDEEAILTAAEAGVRV